MMREASLKNPQLTLRIGKDLIDSLVLNIVSVV